MTAYDSENKYSAWIDIDCLVNFEPDVHIQNL